jgi:probable F420-dependent oxidoreductase
MSVPWTGPLVSPEALVRVAQAADRAGFTYLQVGDHAMYPATIESRYPYSPTGVMPTSGVKLDVLSLFSFLAASTTSIRFMPSVYLISLRNPIATARAVATIDFLSQGRITLGVGVGWMREEFDVLGVPFEERGRITDEYLEILHHLFAGGGAFQGEYFGFPELSFEPRPAAPVPVFVGGGDSGPVFRRVARFGAGWIPAGMTPDRIGAAVPRLREALAAAGRDGDDVVVHARFGRIDPATTSADEVLGRLAEMDAAGCASTLVDLGETTSRTLDEVLDNVAWFTEQVMPKAPGR